MPCPSQHALLSNDDRNVSRWNTRHTNRGKYFFFYGTTPVWPGGIYRNIFTFLSPTRD